MLKNEFEGKTILIAVPDYIGIPDRFKENLQALGFDVFTLSSNNKLKIGIINTLIHFYKKTIYGIRTFKREERQLLDFSRQLNDLKRKKERFDFALFIRSDNFSNKLIEVVKANTDKIAAYQWDGMSVYPEVYAKVSLFERFFVFDVNDVKTNVKFLPLTNFYFDDIKPKKNTNDVYFVGNYKEDRIEALLNLSRKLRDLGINTKAINLCVKSKQQANLLKNEPINIVYNEVTFIENIANSSSSKIIIDVANAVHCGLSMRPFEALGYKKKLITNNVLIKNYDFYHPDNIFVIENGNLDGLENFIALPYKDIPENIVEKYSFSNWIKYVFDIQPHIPIGFPKQMQ